MAVLNIVFEVHEVLPTGECSGKTLTTADLAEVGLKPKMIAQIKGFDKFECLKKLKQKLEELKNDN